MEPDIPFGGCEPGEIIDGVPVDALPPPATGSAKRKLKPPQKPESVPFPPVLFVQEFVTVWAEWIKARPKLSEIAAGRQLKTLAKLESVQKAIEHTENSLQNDWIGLFPEKVTTKPTVFKSASERQHDNILDQVNSLIYPPDIGERT